jgi:hypothetical protein
MASVSSFQAVLCTLFVFTREPFFQNSGCQQLWGSAWLLAGYRWLTEI